MLPTTSATSQREPIKYDLDSLLADMSKPKEQINSGASGFNNNNGLSPSIEGDEATNRMAGGGAYSAEPGEQITADEAALTGKIIAGTIDEAVGTGLSLYAKNSDSEKYKANPDQRQKMAESWAKVAQHSNFKLEDAPWFNALFLTGAVYIPKWQDARNDRRFAQIDDKMEEMKREIQNTRAELESIRKEKTTETAK